MKNIHLIPTDKPSRLWVNNLKRRLEFEKDDLIGSNTAKHIYITSNEEIKEGDYFLYDEIEIRYKTNGTEYHGRDLCHISGNRRYPVNKSKKIILTTDQDLIGVQTIDDEFLEWFVKNPSCEEVEVSYEVLKPFESENKGYLIHCPDNEPLEEPKDVVLGSKTSLDAQMLDRFEPKQETLEKAAHEYFKRGQLGFEKAADTEEAFLKGAKWQAERMYSEEEVLSFLNDMNSWPTTFNDSEDIREWFEQFKKK